MSSSKSKRKKSKFLNFLSSFPDTLDNITFKNGLLLRYSQHRQYHSSTFGRYLLWWLLYCPLNCNRVLCNKLEFTHPSSYFMITHRKFSVELPVREEWAVIGRFHGTSSTAREFRIQWVVRSFQVWNPELSGEKNGDGLDKKKKCLGKMKRARALFVAHHFRTPQCFLAQHSVTI